MKHIFSLDFIKKVQVQLPHRETVQLGTYFSLNTDTVKYFITAYAPQEVQQLLIYLFDTSTAPQSSTLFVIATALSFCWIISKGFYGISTAANITYQVPLLKFAFLERIFSFIMLCLMVGLLLVALILIFLGKRLSPLSSTFLI